MSLIKNATTDWSDPVTLSNDEIWQSRSGNVFITTTPDPEPEDGLSMVLREGIRLGAGLTVRYRKSGDVAALIAREVVR